MTVAGVVLAAGRGSRFGTTKQLAELDGRPLLQHALDVACAAPELDRVVLVLGADAERIAARLRTGRAELVTCAGWEEGIAASLRCGAAAAGDADWLVVTLGDEPRLPRAAIARVVAAARAAPATVLGVRARWGERPGHPVALRRELLPAIAELRGDRGARELLACVPTVDVDCADLGDAVDVDVPEQLAGLRARTTSR